MTYLENYVYCHFRNDTNVVFYIGKGSGNRCFSSKGRNQYWNNVVKKSNGFSVKIIASNLTETEAFNFERLLITKLKLDPKVKLTNLVDGGKGGLNPSKSTLTKQRKAKLGKNLSQQHKESIRQANLKRVYTKGAKHTLEANKLKSRRMLGRKLSKETKANISKAKKEKHKVLTDQEKLNISIGKSVSKILNYIERSTK